MLSLFVIIKCHYSLIINKRDIRTSLHRFTTFNVQLKRINRQYNNQSNQKWVRVEHLFIGSFEDNEPISMTWVHYPFILTI